MQSGAKTGKATTGKGNLYLKAALGQMAVGAAKTDTFFGQRYRRLIKRMPKAKAQAALQRSILTIIFHLLADPTATYHDLGPDFYTKRLDTQRRTRNLVAPTPSPRPPRHPHPRRLTHHPPPASAPRDQPQPRLHPNLPTAAKPSRHSTPMIFRSDGV